MNQYPPPQGGPGYPPPYNGGQAPPVGFYPPPSDGPPNNYGPPPDQYGGQYGGPPNQYGGPPNQYGGPPGQYGGPPGQYGGPPGQYGGPPGQYGGPPGQYGGQPGQYGGQYGPPPGQYGPPGAPPGPITSQPGVDTSGWMQSPQGPPNCPPGLAYLMSVSSLHVKQKVEMLEAFIGFETKNKYTIKNQDGQKVYMAKEDTDCCTRNCLGPLRPFDMRITDIYENEVIHLYRNFRCDSCLCPCFLQKMEVYCPPGNLVGTVEQNWSILTPSFDIKDQTGETVLKIEGPVCTFSICGAVEFKVLSKDGSVQVGKISKEWSGVLREMFTDADSFGISFPIDLDVRMKATMIGACFLIDMMFFEKQNNKESDGLGML